MRGVIVSEIHHHDDSLLRRRPSCCQLCHSLSASNCCAASLPRIGALIRLQLPPTVLQQVGSCCLLAWFSLSTSLCRLLHYMQNQHRAFGAVFTLAHRKCSHCRQLSHAPHLSFSSMVLQQAAQNHTGLSIPVNPCEPKQ